MSTSPLVRDAKPSDADAIAVLLGHLGYPATASDVAERIKRMDNFDGAVVFVAAVDDAVVGVITCHVFPAIHSTAPAAWVTALSIHNEHQRVGAGRALVERAEQWARSRGAERIGVTSALHRDGAHAFYERLGWERTGVRLGKKLG